MFPHFFTVMKHFGPSEVRVTSGANLGRPLFLVNNLFFFCSPAAVTKIPEGVVVGFRNLAWAPNSQKYNINKLG